jgi:hypothetical protein
VIERLGRFGQAGGQGESNSELRKTVQVISVDYHDDLKEVQGDPALAALLCAPAARAPFDRLSWWQGLVEECGLKPLVCIARDGPHRAVMALCRGNGRLEPLANWYSFRNRVLFTPGADRGPMLEALAHALAKESHRVLLDKLTDDDGQAGALATAFRRAGWTARREACDVNHVLDVGGRSFEQYLAGRPGSLRTTLKRKAGKVEVAIHTDFDEPGWRAFEAIYAASWKPNEGAPRFLERFAREEGAAGRLRLGLAMSEGEPIAAQFWTVEAGTAFIHKLAYRQEARPLSPGTTLSAALFAHVIDRDRVELIDFGTGDDGYKRDWMERVRTRYRLELMRPGVPANWPAIGRNAVRSLAGRVARG